MVDNPTPPAEPMASDQLDGFTAAIKQRIETQRIMSPDVWHDQTMLHVIHLYEDAVTRLHATLAAEKARADAAEGQVKAWEDIVRQAYRGIEYFQALLDSAASHLGPEIFVSDDGTVNDYLLRAKVPEMVGELATRLAVSEARSERRRVMLTDLQWAGEVWCEEDGCTKCPSCYARDIDGHRSDCKLATEIADVAPATAERRTATLRDLEGRAMKLVLSVERDTSLHFRANGVQCEEITAILVAYADLQAADGEKKTGSEG